MLVPQDSPIRVKDEEIYEQRMQKLKGAISSQGCPWSTEELVHRALIGAFDLGGGALPGDAGAAFYTRLMLFILIAFYGTISVAVFDAFWPGRNRSAPATGA